MPTEVTGWLCNQCHRRYKTYEEALDCEDRCTQPVQRSAPPNPDTSVRFGGSHENRCPENVWSGNMGPCICGGKVHPDAGIGDTDE